MTAGTWDDPDLRIHFDPTDIGSRDGYPYVWHGRPLFDGVKHLIRELNGHRCERCKHPFPPGTPGEWSRCDEQCYLNDHHQSQQPGTWRHRYEYDGESGEAIEIIEAQWRILTVHHLNGVKYDLRWWNLAALCQRCHLLIQGKVRMERPYLRAHSEWFQPHAAGWYAWDKLGEDISRAEALDRLDELLALEHLQGELL